MSHEYKTIDPDYFYKQFEDAAKDMWSEFERLKRDKITNSTDEGEYIENILVKFLERYLPKRLSVGRGYIMNEEGKTSLQQDIVIYNADNYVLLKNSKGFQVFPVECVHATVEVKSTLTRPILEAANKNVHSIKCLSGTRFKVEVATGDIVDVSQYGSVIFSSLFAFQSDSSLKTCVSNFEELSTSIDYLSILNKGNVCYYSKVERLDAEHVVIDSTSVPDRSKNGIMFCNPSKKGPSAYPLATWLEHIIAHEQKYGSSKGRYSIYNYLKIPASEYSLGWKPKK